MKKSDLILKLYGVHQHTELLEALDWDQNNLERISTYVSSRLTSLSDESSFDFSLITKILNEVEEEWGTAARKVIAKMFNTEVLRLNLLNSRSDDVN
jgi:hypothetical protein